MFQVLLQCLGALCVGRGILDVCPQKERFRRLTSARTNRIGGVIGGEVREGCICAWMIGQKPPMESWAAFGDLGPLLGWVAGGWDVVSVGRRGEVLCGNSSESCHV